MAVINSDEIICQCVWDFMNSCVNIGVWVSEKDYMFYLLDMAIMEAINGKRVET